jgi:anti-sigma B factor antagonist
VGLQISIRESGDVAILDLRGRATINGAESEELRSQLQQLIAKRVIRILLNLTDLSQVDSSGLSVIATTCLSLREQGGDLRFLRPRRAVLEAFKVLHLPEVIPTFEDENQALASFRPRSKFAAP